MQYVSRESRVNDGERAEFLPKVITRYAYSVTSGNRPRPRARQHHRRDGDRQHSGVRGGVPR